MNDKDGRIIFCENVKKLRLTHKLTKKRMAEIMGVSVKTLTKIENCEFPKRLSVIVAIKLMQYFKIYPDKLFETQPEQK